MPLCPALPVAVAVGRLPLFSSSSVSASHYSDSSHPQKVSLYRVISSIDRAPRFKQWYHGGRSRKWVSRMLLESCGHLHVIYARLHYCSCERSFRRLSRLLPLLLLLLLLLLLPRRCELTSPPVAAIAAAAAAAVAAAITAISTLQTDFLNVTPPAG